MPKPESETLTPPSPESALYAQLFAEWLPSMRSFLDVLFPAIFKSWGTFTLVAYDDNDDIKDFTNFAPFCTAIVNLDLRKETCFKCKQRMKREVARARKPLQYWCDWGLWEIIVPILIHDVTVGVILCGQKRLEGDDDLDGKRKLEICAAKNDVEFLLPELREQRSLCPAVSPSRVEEMVDILWATSQLISQMLYNKLEETTRSERAAAEALEKLFAGFRELDGNHTPPESFWNAIDKQLDNLSTALDGRCIAVVLETKEKHQVAALHGLGGAKPEAPSEAHLISSTIKNITGPEHLELTEQSILDCFLTSHVLKTHPSTNMVVFDKAELGDDRVLHLLVYFDPTVPHRNRLFLHQKKQALSRFLRDSASFFLHSELVEQLRKELKGKDDLLQDVVHQINQPLQGILSDCENLANPDYSAERKEKIARYLPFRAKHLARDAKLVQYAAQEGSLRSIEQHPSNVNLSKLLIETAIEYQGYGEDKFVRIMVDTAVSDSLGEVLIDRDHFALALTNVVFNAVKYAFPETTVTIRPEMANQLLRILVIDNGIEIKPSERESIFSKGVRTELAQDFSASGLGIGLYVTRELMRGMGGDAVVVDSSPTGRVHNEFREYSTTIALQIPQPMDLNSGGTNE
jgi:signal transduction histidine kinase/ligand-binding sensor protein